MGVECLEAMMAELARRQGTPAMRAIATLMHDLGSDALVTFADGTFVPCDFLMQAAWAHGGQPPPAAAGEERGPELAALERIVRPIVEGQIRGFLKEHPSIAAAVDWYTPGADRRQTLINSLSKRIVRDLTCAATTARLRGALLELGVGARPDAARGSQPDGGAGAPGSAYWGRPIHPFDVKQS